MLNAQFHPDQLLHRPQHEQERATQMLALANEVYQTVFSNEQARDLYDKVCVYRREYLNLLHVEDERLTCAATNLSLLHSSIRSAGMPRGLQDEIQSVLDLLYTARGIVPE